MLERIESETGLSKAQISAIVVEALETGSYFAPEFIDELNIEINPKEVK